MTKPLRYGQSVRNVIGGYLIPKIYCRSMKWFVCGYTHVKVKLQQLCGICTTRQIGQGMRGVACVGTVTCRTEKWFISRSGKWLVPSFGMVCVTARVLTFESVLCSLQE
jgi:hypothetical protein